MIPLTYESRLAQALPALWDRVGEAAERGGRDAADVTLVAVTKAHPLDAVQAALSHGLFDLGENRVEELEWKTGAVEDERIRWHMIGHVQRRKAPRLVGMADLVHSVDSLRLAERLSRAAVEEGETLSVLIQVNTSGEESKGGFASGRAAEEARMILELPGLEAWGLMTMAPFTEDERVLRSAFQGVKELDEELRGSDGYTGRELSMGMTNDFEIAIEEGSTMIRIGTALFGRRVPHD